MNRKILQLKEAMKNFIESLCIPDFSSSSEISSENIILIIIVFPFYSRFITKNP